jgi:hypothetical protein
MPLILHLYATFTCCQTHQPGNALAQHPKLIIIIKIMLQGPLQTQ